MTYFIYKYEWDDGSIYIGQSNDTQYRFGNTKKYKQCKLVYNKMLKYPIFSQEIIENNLTEYNIDDREIYWISYYNSYWYDNPEFGLNLTKGGQGIHGYRHSETTKVKMKENYIYHTNSGCFKENQTAWNKGISNTWTPYEKIVENSKKRCRKVIDNFGNIYESAAEAGRLLNIDSSNITKICRGKEKSAKGYTFQYYGGD